MALVGFARYIPEPSTSSISLLNLLRALFVQARDHSRAFSLFVIACRVAAPGFGMIPTGKDGGSRPAPGRSFHLSLFRRLTHNAHYGPLSLALPQRYARRVYIIGIMQTTLLCSKRIRFYLIESFALCWYSGPLLLSYFCDRSLPAVISQ